MDVPAALVAEVLILRADVAAATPGVTELGEKAQLAPGGKVNGAQVSVTVLLKPFTPATVTV